MSATLSAAKVTRPSKRLVGAIAAVLLIAACDQQAADAPAPQAPPPAPVTVANPLVETVTEWDEFTGRFEAVNRVEIRARVSGYLNSVHFDDGQLVKKGDLLFSIDPRVLEAERSVARATLLQAEAQLKLTVRDLERAESLSGSSAISQQTVDERRTEKLVAEAEVAAARARVRNADLNVEFTEVRAPINGRISDRRVDVGNLISGGSAQSDPLAIIVSLNPMYFVFDASESDFLRYTRLSKSGVRTSSRDKANPVYVKLMDEENWFRRGEMNFLGNELDSNSGTIRGRAIFDNSDQFLTAGVFGRLRLIGSAPYEATLLPDAAILADQSSKIVFLVDEEGTVSSRKVEIGPMIRGLRVVRGGLKATDKVIISGVQRARPGGKVTPQEGQIVAVDDGLNVEVPDDDDVPDKDPEPASEISGQ